MRTWRIAGIVFVVAASLAADSTARGQCNPAQLSKHTASDGAANDNYGISVAVSGNVAVVGAWGATTGGGAFAGAAYVLNRSGGAWSQQAKLTASDGATNDAYGISVAVSGETAVVGSFLDDTPAGADAGSVYVYTRSGSVWTQQAKLTALDAAAGDEFGISVAIESDTIIVGAESDDTPGGANSGSAYVFTRSAGVWTQQAKLTASDGAADDRFGYGVAVSGNTAIVSALGDDTPGGANAGSAYVFTRCGAAWSQQAKLTASDGAANDSFGVSVAISGDSAVIGAYTNDTPAGVNAGSAYVFTRSGATWTQQAMLTAPDAAANDQFGISVAIQGDVAIVGAYTDDTGGGVDAGSIYAFARSSDPCSPGWSLFAHLFASDGAANDVFGYVLAMSGDALVVGAFSDDTTGGAEAGSVYAFDLACDSDGDGVVNSQDVCPNNAPGLPVDATGRPLRDCNFDCAVNGLDAACIVDEMLGA